MEDQELMLMTSSKYVLLTGAGFTHNFGAPLASELWAMIMNHGAIQNARRVQNAVLSDFDFESVYQQIMTGDYSLKEKGAMARGVEDAYGHVDKIIRSWGSEADLLYPINVYGVQELIARFAGTNTEPGFFFTLNQDIFIERYYYNGICPHLPGIQQHTDNWFTAHFSGPVQDQDYVTLPGSKAIENEATFFESAAFYYLKLHGSSNWRSADGTKRMVIGQNKETQINNEPLLSKYFEVFTRVLSEGDRRLLVIGYGFRDSHVNKVIANAIQNHGLRLFVMTPEQPTSLRDRLCRDELGQEIWSGLGGYFPWGLMRIFPENQSQTSEWGAVKNQFFQRPGRKAF
jgi:hypothetical protein